MPWPVPAGGAWGAALRNHHRAIAAIVIVVVAAAAILSFVLPPTYRATAILLLDERNTSTDGIDLNLQAAEADTQQYIDDATSPPLAARVCARVSGRVPCDPRSLPSQVMATSIKGTSQIAVTVADRDPDAAATLADAVATQLVADLRTQSGNLVGPTLSYLNQQLAQLSAQMDGERAALADVPTAGRSDLAISRDQAPHLAHLNELETEYGGVYQRIQSLTVNQTDLDSELSIIQPATAPERPSSPDPALDIGAALIAGLALGLLYALFRERGDHPLRRGSELARAAGLELVIDEASAHAGGEADPAAAPSAADAGPGRLLARCAGARSILVVGAAGEDRATATASGLARAAAHFGRQVLLLEALEGGGGGEDRIEAGSGAVTTERPAASEMAATLERDGPGYDLTVLALPAPLRSPLAVLLAARGGAVVMVATSGRTRFQEARETARLLRHSGADPELGVLVAPGPPAASPNGNGAGAR